MRDLFHEAVRIALEKEGWVITDNGSFSKFRSNDIKFKKFSAQSDAFALVPEITVIGVCFSFEGKGDDLSHDAQ
jgi:XisH protein